MEPLFLAAEGEVVAALEAVEAVVAAAAAAAVGEEECLDNGKRC